jgi:hypothetical protein
MDPSLEISIFVVNLASKAKGSLKNPDHWSSALKVAAHPHQQTYVNNLNTTNNPWFNNQNRIPMQQVVWKHDQAKKEKAMKEEKPGQEEHPQRRQKPQQAHWKTIPMRHYEHKTNLHIQWKKTKT